MKRITAMILLLSLCLLCFGCSRTPAEPQIRYEDTKAYYTQEGSKYAMEIQFTEPVTEGSTISLLLEEEEIIGFTAEASFSKLHLSSLDLELDKPYVLKVNGELQRHGKNRPVVEATEPGYIPEPTVPTIPLEPMGDTTTSPTVSDENTEDKSPFDTPPTIAEDISLGDISSITGVNPNENSSGVNSNGTLTTEPINADKVQTEDSALRPNIQIGGTTFTLTGTVTGFVSVQNAS